MNIYLYRRDQYIGPYPVENIRDMVAAGQVLVSEPAIQEGSQEWRTVGDFIGAAEPMIHVSQNGEQQGPYTLDQLNAELSKGNVQPTAHGFCDGMTDWVLLTEIPGVVVTRATPSAPAAASAKSFIAKKEDVKQSKSAPKSGNAPSRILVLAGGVAGFAALVSIVWFYFFRGPASPFDPNNPDHRVIEAAIRKAISKPEGIITDEDFLKVKRLHLSDGKLKDISLLSKLVAVEDLNLGRNKLGDLGPLSGLKSINTLNLSGNQITDLRPIEALENIESLDISGNQISDISGLEKMQNLKGLKMGGNRIIDLSALSNMLQMESLDVGGNQVEEVAALLNHKNLKMLNLGNNKITNTQALKGLGSLEILILEGNPLEEGATESLRESLPKCQIIF